MANNHSFRIELHGQTLFTSKITIDRSMPAMLSDRMSNQEWIAFCDRVDQALEPTHTIKRRLACYTALSVAASFGIFIMIAILGATGSIVSSYGGFNPLYIILFVSFIVVPVTIQCHTFRQTYRKIGKVYEDLRRVVNEESSKRSDISFHLKEEIHVGYSTTSRVQRTTVNYIECCISLSGGQDGNYNPMNATVASPVVIPSMFDTMSGAGGRMSGKSTLERLQELEGIKAILSEEEYNK
eukprot:CAMPEP_0176479432 /NCGR_PEP_ID=MMETSP0200_2-20121128/1739_1 /TAXON_ID=947934 /ORGANISM="Chaetoceros sp., Strain GSL56" /LENGTH=239 /DNA_ID=CAMNT_0017875481 /DNA_START=56 /DNA_END=772 /DNA_ORIENTATION=-